MTLRSHNLDPKILVFFVRSSNLSQHSRDVFAGLQVVVATGLGISGRVSGRSTDDKAEIPQYPATIQREDRIEILTGSRASTWLKIIDVACLETDSLGSVTIVSATPSGKVTFFLPVLHFGDQTQTPTRSPFSCECR